MRLLGTRIAAAMVLTVGCSTEPAPADPGDTLYAAEFDPPMLVYATTACDRFLNHGILSLSRRLHSFDLSVNLFDDCSRGGGGFSFWEVLVLGTYSYRDSVVTFTPTSGATPPFAAMFDGKYMKVTLPARSDSLAPTPVLIQLGPGEHF